MTEKNSQPWHDGIMEVHADEAATKMEKVGDTLHVVAAAKRDAAKLQGLCLKVRRVHITPHLCTTYEHIFEGACNPAKP